ncbi:MAG: hypothetical protein LAT67_14410, partial [Balneolales bacterium]|nr:hypothetical protein [Balneolales bacterium]
PCDHEWRCVVVGDSYFGHKKLRTRGEMMSGTSAVSWDVPSEKLLDFVKDVMQKTGFYSQAVDVFESKDGEFYINELQAFWGSKNPHQMLRNGIPGRYVKINDKWIFEEGEFNTNNSYDLRLKHALSLFHGNRL